MKQILIVLASILMFLVYINFIDVLDVVASIKPNIPYRLKTTMLNDSIAQIEGYNNGKRFYIRINDKGQIQGFLILELCD